MKLKLQGFELEIQGSREDASVIGRNIGDQISAMISPAVNIVEGDPPPNSPPQSLIAPPGSTKRRTSRRSRAVAKDAAQEGAQRIEFRHDAGKFGVPSQQWNTANKAIWLLYVVKETIGIGELSTGQIVKTFNVHFRQAKTVTSSNVARDLGRAKLSAPALVGEDPTKTPSAWFLTDEGIRHAQSLIAESLVPKAA